MMTQVPRRSSDFLVLALLLAALLGPADVAAQEAIVPLQFSYSDPGARSLGFGGAFVALADDATAAFANPAGLVQLLRPEISIEGRRWDYSTPYTLGGRLEGQASGNGLDNTDGLRTAKSGDEVTGLSFLSFAYPGEDWSIAVFRHELANFDFSSETQGFFLGGTDCCQNRDVDQRASTDVELVGYGLSAAYRLSDAFDLGLGVVYYDASIDTAVTQFAIDDDSLESIFGRNSYLPENSIIGQTTHADSDDWTLTGGFLWRPSPNWSIGGVYRQGPKIDSDAVLIAGQAVDFGVPPGGVLARGSVEIEFPDYYGLGFAYRAADGDLTLSFQWAHVEYSSIADSLDLDDQNIDDVDELHLGGEYVFLGSTPIVAVRLGMWWEPDHQLQAKSDAEPRTRALLRGGDDQMHYAAGVGVAMQKFQIDLGVDLADRVNTLSLSTIYSF